MLQESILNNIKTILKEEDVTVTAAELSDLKAHGIDTNNVISETGEEVNYNLADESGKDEDNKNELEKNTNSGEDNSNSGSDKEKNNGNDEKESEPINDYEVYCNKTVYNNIEWAALVKAVGGDPMNVGKDYFVNIDSNKLVTAIETAQNMPTDKLFNLKTISNVSNQHGLLSLFGIRVKPKKKDKSDFYVGTVNNIANEQEAIDLCFEQQKESYNKLVNTSTPNSRYECVAVDSGNKKILAVVVSRPMQTRQQLSSGKLNFRDSSTIDLIQQKKRVCTAVVYHDYYAKDITPKKEKEEQEKKQEEGTTNGSK